MTIVDPAGSLIPTLGGIANAAQGVNNSGVIVGESQRMDGSLHAFKWTQAGSTVEVLPSLGTSRAFDINESGVIVGSVTEGGELRAFRHFPQDSLELLPSLVAGFGAEAFAVNASNVTVGMASNAASHSEAVRWDAAGNITALAMLGGETSIAQDVNDAGVIVGESETGGGQTRAFKWTCGGGIQALPMPFGSFSSASGINSAGFIAGYIDSQPVVWRPDGSVMTLGSLGGTGGLATDLNDLVEVVGQSRDGSGTLRAFAWDSIDGMTALGSGRGIAAAISSNRIAGSLLVSGSNRAAHWQVAPSAAPTLQCDSVQRGQTATCQITEAVDSVIGWRFEAERIFVGHIEVTSASSQTSWTGQAVVDGQVKVFIIRGGQPDSLSDSLRVAARPWGWGPSNWTFHQDSGGTAGCFVPFYLPAGARLGVNLRKGEGCQDAKPGIISPSLAGVPFDSGFSMRPVNGGPNHGIWFVDSTTYHINRGSSRNPYLTANGLADTLTHGQDQSRCRSALGIPNGQPIVVNYRTFNESCRNFALAAFDSALYRHEAFGITGINANSSGHEGRIHYRAGQPGGDPRLAIEPLVALSSSLLRGLLGNAAVAVDGVLDAFGGDHTFVRNNYIVNGACGTTWVLHTAPQRRYLSVRMEAADSAGIRCM